jgi:tetratricopeptide (TPR) repeat protein
MSSRITRLPIIAAALVAPIAAGCGGQDRTPSTTSQTGSVAATPASTTVESASLTPPVVDAAAANVSYADAEKAYNGGRYEEATGLFAGYSARHPENPWGFYMYGLSAWKSGDHDRAIEAFDEALKLDPNHRKSLLNSARVLLETEKPQEALDRIERVLTIDPVSGEALRLQGRARSELGQVPEAIDAYQRAIALDDRDVWAMNNLGLIYIHQGRSDEALGPLARAVELRSDAPVFQNNLGMALELSGHTAAARHSYASALEADSAYSKAAASLTRLGGPVEDPVADSAQTVDLAVISQQFQARIQQWKDTTSTATSDSAVVEEMVRDSVQE